jgi:hypothetical protein
MKKKIWTVGDDDGWIIYFSSNRKAMEYLEKRKVKWVNGVIALKLDVINAMLIYVMSIQVFRSLSVDIANMTARWI